EKDERNEIKRGCEFRIPFLFHLRSYLLFASSPANSIIASSLVKILPTPAALAALRISTSVCPQNPSTCAAGNRVLLSVINSVAPSEREPRLISTRSGASASAGSTPAARTR